MNFPATSKYALMIVFAALLQGCVVSSYYAYDGQRYSTGEEALNAQKRKVSENVAGVKKNSPYVGGKALVYIPPRHVLRENGVKTTGTGTNKAIEAMVNHAVTSLEIGFFGIADTVKKGEFFDSVVVGRSLSEIQSESPDYVISLDVTGFNQAQWYAYRADNVSNKIPVFVEGTKTDSDKLNSFNDSLSKALISLGSNAGK